MVLLIALIPALAVLITSFVTDSKSKTTIAAIIAAAIGVFTGNPVYALFDLVLVAGAYWIAMSGLKDSKRTRLEDAERLNRIIEMERVQLDREMANDPDSGFKDRCDVMDADRARRKAANAVKLQALRARLEAERAAVIETVPALAIKGKRKVRRTGEAVKRE
jgi:hypothetical protein